MEEFNQEVQKVQDSLQEELKTGEMGKTQRAVDKEKAAFERVMGNIKRLSEDINGYVKKFDNIKEEIETSNKKYETYKMEMETKKQQVQLLETQIQNIVLMGQLRDKTKSDTQEQRQQVTQQMETLRNLTKALNDQLQAI